MHTVQNKDWHKPPLNKLNLNYRILLSFWLLCSSISFLCKSYFLIDQYHTVSWMVAERQTDSMLMVAEYHLVEFIWMIIRFIVVLLNGIKAVTTCINYISSLIITGFQ